MGCNQDCRMMLARVIEQIFENVLGGRQIQIACRLIGKDEAGRVDERARDRDTLLLAS